MKHPLQLGIDAGVKALSLARSVRLARALKPALRARRPPTIFLAVVVAVAVGALASSLALTTGFLVGVRVELLGSLSPWARGLLMVGLPTLGALVVGMLMVRLVPEASGSGIPQVKAAYHLQAGAIRGRVVLGKWLLCAASIGSGMSLGREGPSVHIGGAFGSWLGRRLAVKRATVKRLSAIGGACGVAAAFNAPIAAIMFLLEEIVGDLRHALFGAVIVAVVLATAISINIAGDYPLLGSASHAFFGSEMVGYVLLGITAGLLGRGFIALILNVRAWACGKFENHHRLLRYALGGAATGLITFAVYLATDLYIIGSSGVGDIAPIAAGGIPLLVLLALCGGKVLATAMSYMTQLPGGLFGPSLFIGATAGAALAEVINLAAAHSFVSTVDVGAFAVVGMAALFGGVARSPITALMIVVEITDDYGLILPLMLASSLSVFIVQLKFRGSIYDLLLRQDGISVHVHEQHALLASTTVEEVMSHEVLTLSHDMTIEQALARADTHETHRLHVVTGEDGLMIGLVSPTDLVWELAHGHPDITLGSLVAGRRIVHAHPDQELDSVIEKITHFEFTEFPVVPRDNEKHVIGIVGLHEITLYRRSLGI